MNKKGAKPGKWLLKAFRMQAQDVQRLERIRDSFLPLKKIVPLSTLVSAVLLMVSKMPPAQVLKAVEELNKERSK
jgi:hypothetical protein